MYLVSVFQSSFSDFERLSFSQELTPTLTLGFSFRLGLGLAWGHIEDKIIFTYTTFKHFSLDVYDDIHVLHFVSDCQRLSFCQELTPTLTLGSSFLWGLGLAWRHIEDKKFSPTRLLNIFLWTSTTIFTFCIWFEILNAYRFPRS